MDEGSRWHRFDSAEAVAQAAAARIFSAAQESIAERGLFRVVLAGGSTPKATYALLRDMPAQWDAWSIYFGDERCLPPAHPERNSVMAREAWLAHVPIPAEQVFEIPAELGPEPAAQRYAPVVDGAVPFDLVLLGMGEDGHTASLFPGRPLDDSALVAAVFDAPKPPAERVSLGLGALNASHEVLILVTGEGKREAVRRWRACEDLPVARVHGLEGADVYVDTAAWPEA